VRTVTRRQILQTYDAVFYWRGGVWAALLLSTVLAFAVLVWDRATGMSAEEYHSIGILKAVGWTSREVLELKLLEGGIVSDGSLLTGLVAAQIHLVVFDGAVFSRPARVVGAVPRFEVAGARRLHPSGLPAAGGECHTWPRAWCLPGGRLSLTLTASSGAES
jgi:hypothetical protein